MVKENGNVAPSWDDTLHVELDPSPNVTQFVSAVVSSVSKQFGSFYRYITLQMNMSREDRDPSDVLTAYALKEYERLQQEAPSLSGASIKAFKSKFSNGEQAIPDIAEDKFVIHVTQPVIVKDVELGNSDGD